MTISQTSSLAVQLADAETAVKAGNAQKATQLYKDIIATQQTGEDVGRHRETAMLKLGALYRDQRASQELASLVAVSHQFLASLPKAKTAKIVRTLVDYFSDIPEALSIQVQVCKETIDWATEEKRVYLKQALETRLVALYLDNKIYTNALSLIAQLLKELKRLDDKMALVEVQLLESRVYHALRNMAKARASLTSARTSANSIYCPPLVQAALDIQSGILHAEEKDYKTAYSYFYETMEGFASQDDPRAALALKYMLLCKIMLNLAEDVHSLVHGKLALRYSGAEVDAMKAVATAHQNRSLLEFEQALLRYKQQLNDDPVIRLHLTALYETLLEQNLSRIIEPFSRVEISHVAEMVKLPVAQVEINLIDNKTNQQYSQQTYDDCLDTIKKMGTVVDSLYQKAASLS